MNTRHIPFLMILACMCMPTLSFSQVNTLNEPRQTKWEKTKDKDDIVIYEGNILNDGAVPLKGHVIIHHPIEKVVTVMADSNGKKDWLPAVEKIKILDQPNPYIKTEYYIVTMPFIVSNRTTALRSEATVSEDLSEVIVRLYSSKDFPEKNNSYVRATMNYGEVRLRSVDRGRKTIVSGIFYTNPQGFLPKWIVKRFTREFVYESLVKLRNKVGRNLYDEQVINKYADLIKSYKGHSRAIASGK